MKEYLDINRKLWDHWADLHPRSDFYDAVSFRKNPMTLHEIERALLPELAGKASRGRLVIHFSGAGWSWRRRRTRFRCRRGGRPGMH
jgi:hypothetical protein